MATAPNAMRRTASLEAQIDVATSSYADPLPFDGSFQDMEFAPNSKGPFVEAGEEAMLSAQSSSNEALKMHATGPVLGVPNVLVALYSLCIVIWMWAFFNSRVPLFPRPS